MSWGLMERFRGYIDGFAKGAFTPSADVSFSGTEWTWSTPTGSVDPATGTGQVAFPGSVLATGHGDVLKMNFANPVVEFVSSTEANLKFDIDSNDTTGAPTISEKAITIGTFALTPGLSGEAGSTVTMIGTGGLSEAAVPAFADFYQAGEPFDPMTLSLTLGECAGAATASAEPTDDAATTPEPEMTTLIAPEDENEGSNLMRLWVVLGVVVVAGVATVIVVRQRRARKSPEQEHSELPESGDQTS
nr:HtaA domain-containing protein [Lysinibacter cavernae]